MLWHAGSASFLCALWENKPNQMNNIHFKMDAAKWWVYTPLGRDVAVFLLTLRRHTAKLKPNVNKSTLINDLISVPHHMADDKFGDGRLGGTACGFPPLFGAVRWGGGIKAEQGCYQGPAEELTEIKEEVVKMVKGNGVPPRNPPHTDTQSHTHFLGSV